MAQVLLHNSITLVAWRWMRRGMSTWLTDLTIAFARFSSPDKQCDVVFHCHMEILARLSMFAPGAITPAKQFSRDIQGSRFHSDIVATRHNSMAHAVSQWTGRARCLWQIRKIIASAKIQWPQNKSRIRPKAQARKLDTSRCAYPRHIKPLTSIED